MNEPTISPRTLTRHEATDRSHPTPTAEAEVDALARHRDPSLARGAAGLVPKGARGVEWVRPTELVAQRAGRVAGRGIDFEAELYRRSRLLPVQAARVTRTGISNASARLSDRARRLPPASAFGRGGTDRYSWVSPSGIGLG